MTRKKATTPKKGAVPTLEIVDAEPITSQRVEAAEAQIVEQSKRIEFYLADYSVELLAQKLKNGDFEIPAYQRLDTWEPERKSRFVESILMGLPIPFLFFWERPETGKLEVVDGSQRLRTIHQFILEDLQLGPLDQLTELEGFRFRDLPDSRQRKIKNRSIRGIVLNEHADEQARFDIFERINTSSKIANKAEIRRGALIGPFLSLVAELAEDSLFVTLAPVPEQSVKTREREELVTRFFAYGDGLDGYRDRPAEFLFAYSKKMNGRFTVTPTDIDVYRKRFSDTMLLIKRIFPLGFRKSARGTETPRNRFEALAIGTYLAMSLKPNLAKSVRDTNEWINSEEFIRLTKSGGSNAIASLKGRVNFVRDQLLGAT